jgi:hypothetical protein
MRKAIITGAVVAAIAATGCTIETTEEPASSPTTEADTSNTIDTTDWPRFAREAFLDGCGHNERCECMLELVEDEYASPLDLPNPRSPEYEDIVAEGAEECVF